MSTYQSTRSQNNSPEDKRNTENNTKNLRNAADVAIASKNPYAMAAGAIVKGADKLTGGKSTEALGKAMTQANKSTPGGKKIQKASNKLSESGASDAIGKAASMQNSAGGAQGTSTGANSIPSANPGMSTPGNPQQPSPTSSSESFSGGGSSFAGMGGGFSKQNSFSDNQEDSGTEQGTVDISGSAFGKFAVKTVIILFAPMIIIFMIFFGLMSAVTNNFSDYEDALGASGATGGETGGIVYTASNPEAKEFYQRINTVKLSMQANGKSVDALKIAAVYHILTTNDPNIDYEYMIEARIREIADAMFSGNSYSESTFKENLINNIFPKYISGTTQKKREQMAEDVFDYIDRYYSFIGLNTSSTCAAIGSCTYEIKGFYIPGSGNVTKSMSIKDLKVRLMECASPYGNGNYNTPIDQDLVSFEDYVAGVAYAEIGDYAPDEAIKAQMIVARSFALARPTAMGNALGKKLEEENGQWILQISSCVADQVFCNINEGCSYMGGGDGQGGIVRSGKVPGALRTRDALAADHKLRTLAASVQGEVLVNNQGNIILSGYLATESNAFTSLANQGLNYKQILLQVYGGSGSRPYGATDIQKMSCNNGSSGCSSASTGPYASWKQYEGPWTEITLGGSGQTIRQIGCLVTSISMLIAKSGVETNISNFNPGTFVEFLNDNGGFVSGGNFVWYSATKAAPSFKYQGKISLSGYTKEQKLNKIKELLNEGAYITAEVKGNTGQHWVAIDAVSGNNVIMMDPGSQSTDLWGQYDWHNTSTLAYFKIN